MKRAIGYLAGVALLSTVVVLPLVLFTAGPAGATVDNCTATIGGANANVFSTPEDAYRVAQHSTVVVTGTNSRVQTGDVLTYDIELQIYLPFKRISWTVASGSTESNTFGQVVDVDKYAKYGSGLYLVHVVSAGPFTGSQCETDAFVNVTASGISDAEIGGIVIGGLGVAGASYAGISAAREGQDLAPPPTPPDGPPPPDDGGPGPPPESTGSDYGSDDSGDSDSDGARIGPCAVKLIPAIALTGSAIANEMVRALARHLTRGVS